MGETVNKAGAIIIDQHVNAYVFSSAISHSKSDHKLWYEREGCKYDLCLKLRAKEFFTALSRKIGFYTAPNSKVRFMLAKPIYNNGIVTLEADPIKINNKYLYKDSELKWEKEYRLVCVSRSLSHNTSTPIFPISLKATKFIEDVININE